MRDRHHSSLRNSWKQAVEGTHMRSGYLVVYIEAAPCRLHSSHGSTPEAMSQQPVQSEESSRAEEHKSPEIIQWDSDAMRVSCFFHLPTLPAFACGSPSHGLWMVSAPSNIKSIS
ncbi:uncharacterized protein LOC144612792 isoform X1 [Panthera onca]